MLTPGSFNREAVAIVERLIADVEALQRIKGLPPVNVDLTGGTPVVKMEGLAAANLDGPPTGTAGAPDPIFLDRHLPVVQTINGQIHADQYLIPNNPPISGTGPPSSSPALAISSDAGIHTITLWEANYQQYGVVTDRAQYWFGQKAIADNCLVGQHRPDGAILFSRDRTSGAWEGLQGFPRQTAIYCQPNDQIATQDKLIINCGSVDSGNAKLTIIGGGPSSAFIFGAGGSSGALQPGIGIIDSTGTQKFGITGTGGGGDTYVSGICVGAGSPPGGGLPNDASQIIANMVHGG